MGQERRSASVAQRRRSHAASSRAHTNGAFGRRIGPAWLTVSQLCDRWQLSRKTIYKFIDAKLLPAWKVGRHLYRIAIDDVLRFESQNRLPAPDRDIDG